MTPRATDWGLAALVAVLVVTGAVGLDTSATWVFAVHDVAGLALGALLVWKLRRVWRRLADPGRWDRRTAAAAAAVLLVAATLASGVYWASAGSASLGGFRLLAWHEALGALLGAAVLVHATWRARPLRRRDIAGRRAFLHTGGLGAFALGAWALQRPVSRLLGAPAADRRFTGSYERGSFAGNAYPATSWVADDPRPLADPAAYRLRVDGLVDRPLRLSAAELDAGDVVEATLDCTGGFYTRQRWGGLRLATVLDRAGPLPDARYVRVVSRTGYRWEFGLDAAREMLLAVRVTGEPVDHRHGAPCRLVAPGRRGFQWVKWVEAVELHERADHGKLAATLLSWLRAS